MEISTVIEDENPRNYTEAELLSLPANSGFKNVGAIYDFNSKPDTIRKIPTPRRAPKFRVGDRVTNWLHGYDSEAAEVASISWEEGTGFGPSFWRVGVAGFTGEEADFRLVSYDSVESDPPLSSIVEDEVHGWFIQLTSDGNVPRYLLTDGTVSTYLPCAQPWLCWHSTQAEAEATRFAWEESHRDKEPTQS